MGIETLPPAHREEESATPTDELEYGSLCGAAVGGKFIDSGRRRRLQFLALHKPSSLECSEPLSKNTGADSIKPGSQITKPLGTDQKLSNDKQRPPFPKNFGSASECTELGIAHSSKKELYTSILEL